MVSILPAQISTAWILGMVFVFIAKQLIADFILQTDWMAQGKEQATGWQAPLFAHVAIHGLLTTLIFAVAAPSLMWVGAIDILVHLSIDRSKSMLTQKCHITPVSGRFWWLLGLDQSLHHVTHLVFALLIAAANTPA